MKAPVSAGWLAMLVANLAKHYLLDPSLELAETACLLEYEDPNSFFRAFREWKGTTPGEREPLPPNLRKFDRPDYLPAMNCSHARAAK
jgi:AraC-like DNA-binding protein